MDKRGKTALHKRAQKIAKMEGRKVQVSIGNILEVLAREEDLMAFEAAWKTKQQRKGTVVVTKSKSLKEMLNAIGHKSLIYFAGMGKRRK